MAPPYSSYAALAAEQVEGVDYTRTSSAPAGATRAAIAIHGGGIEGGSGEMAQHVATTGHLAYYQFAGIKTSGNSDLHITSTLFDEPTGLALVGQSRRTLSFHGFVGTGVAETAIGGLDRAGVAAVTRRLTEAGFAVSAAPSEIAGSAPTNICNRNLISAGVQLEMSNALRSAFFTGGDTSAASRSGPRTTMFDSYAAAVLRALADLDDTTPSVYLGRPGALQALRSPHKGVQANIIKQGQIRSTIGGGRTADYAPGVLRDWSLAWPVLSHDDQSTILAFFAGHNGPGPWVFIDGAARNLLTANQSAATSVDNAPVGFTVDGAGESLASSPAVFERGPRALAWSLPAAPAGGVLVFDPPTDDWPGIPVVPGRAYRLQCRVRGGGTDGVVDVAAKFQWQDTAGGLVRLDAGATVTTSPSGWLDCFIGSTVCPAGAAYLQPQLVAASASVTGAAIVYVDLPMLSMPTDRDPGTDWVAGLGVPRVTLPQADHELPWINYHRQGLAVVEVS